MYLIRLIKSVLFLMSLSLLTSCGDSGDQLSKGHRDAIKVQCEGSSNSKACSLEVRQNFIEDGNEFVILEDGELNKDEIKLIKKECIITKKFGLETYNNCLHDYKIAALNNELFKNKFKPKPKNNIETLEAFTVRIDIIEVISENDFKPLGGGSGVILNDDLIATNCHVTNSATNNKNAVIFIKNINKENYDTATSYKEAPEHDVCIVKKDGRSEFGLKMNAVKKFIKFEKLSRGDFVRTLGTPANLEGHTARGEIQYLGTAGVSGENKYGDYTIADDTKIINHSATIAPGSSGGPLFDKNGYLVGLNTFGSPAWNFSISADHIKDLLNE